MGYAHEPVPDPQHFLKKHTSEKKEAAARPGKITNIVSRWVI